VISAYVDEQFVPGRGDEVGYDMNGQEEPASSEAKRIRQRFQAVAGAVHAGPRATVSSVM
jgi:hypothetical protein